MLVVISDIHLTDLSTAHNVHATAFDLMLQEIATAAQAKGAVELRVVLLGDIFDLVRTDFWHRTTTPDQRPWGGDLDPETGMNRDTALIQTQFSKVLAGVLATPEAKALIRDAERAPGPHQPADQDHPRASATMTASSTTSPLCSNRCVPSCPVSSSPTCSGG